MGKPTTRRKALAVEAVNPQDGKLMVVMFDQRKLLACRDRSQGQLKEAAFTVPMILQHPRAIFGGLLREADEPKRPHEQGWLCYCGVPETAFAQDGAETAPWPHQVFLVFVSSDRIVHNWYWYECDPNDPNLPEGHAERFQRRIL